MNRQPIDPTHRVFIMDLEPQLRGLQDILVDYCDEWSLLNEENLLLQTLCFLYVKDNVKEAVEAMEIHVNTFCHYEQTEYRKERLNSVITAYMTEMNDIFSRTLLYGHDDVLAYDFIGWQMKFMPMFAPHSHASIYADARTAQVQSEPFGTDPAHLFPTIYDPAFANKIYRSMAQRNGQEIDVPWEDNSAY